jgi:predicted ATPase
MQAIASPTWWAQRRCRPAWTWRICGRSFRPTRSASPRLCSASAGLIAAVAHKGEPELRSALDRLIDAGLFFRQGVAPHATYLFKHALVQDAAYGTLLREPRRALHARIAETLESQFAEIAENQPELLARHCTEAGLVPRHRGFDSLNVV